MKAKSYHDLLDRLRLRKRAYREIVLGPPGTASHELLADLATFCRAFEPTFHADPRVHALLEGRREVWLRIQQHLHLEPEQLAELFKAVIARRQGENQ